MSQRGYLAVDIGGTKLSVGVVSTTGEVLSHGRALTPQVNVWQALQELITDQVTNSNVDLIACGVGCGGPMAPQGEYVSTLHIPEWRDFPLRAKLQELVQLPVYIDGDAKALVQGAVWCGAVAGQTEVIGMVVPTGVGGGILSQGKVLAGCSGDAGHLGDVIVVPAGRLCSLVSIGLLDAHAVRRSVQATTETPP